MKKLLAFIKADIQAEVNAWIEENIPNAGPNAFSAPYSVSGKGEITHYATYWRISDADKVSLSAYLDSSHNAKSSWGHIESQQRQEEIANKALKPWNVEG